ncbi:WD40/YVTN/BNR-like repeat-containing protein [Reticulibacter mediterranei]|uniref:WD40/YVTN/BNR-like repeat-containing protein n=1 Tax=Reticulibacter mediterranei TaxID=2778369 RepID=UPI001C690E88|nr:hypothetical protein [Reticulibacter mediterranei]
MKARDQHKSADKQRATPARKSWLTSFGTLLVVLLIIATSIILFVLRGITNQASSPLSTPPAAGQWVNLDNRYLFSSLEAAPTNPALLYACASPYPQPQQGQSPQYTLLRSDDFGAHWQDLSKQVTLRDFCQFTINPANGNELFVVTAGTPTGGNTPDVLKQSSDGGKTWKTLQSRLQDGQANVTWHVQQLRQVGHDLFGIQWTSPLASNVTQLSTTTPSRLVHSSDEGQTWTPITNPAASITLIVHDYAVNPNDTRTIYEIAGPPPRLSEPGITPGAKTTLMTLYKTTDGGANWQQLLNDILPDSTLQLASAKPTTLFVGEAMSNRALNDTSVPMLSSTAPISFRIRTSTDGGATWQTTLQVQGASGFVHGWFSTIDGQLYALSSANGSNNSTIRRYDPASKQWNDVTKPPQPGDLLAVTPTGTNNGAVFWLRSFVGGKTALYRYVSG